MPQATGYFTHPLCSLHEMGAGHPECPERLSAITAQLQASGLAAQLVHRQATAASLADLELAHDRMHLAALRGLSDALREDIAAGGPTHAQVDPDTAINLHSWDAMRVAAGAAIDAVDAVMAGELRNAFCAVRPPGHHATRNRAMGFCFVNNVAVAAKYALQRHGLKRVAIIDFDVHHGNGTEDIIAGDERILMCSFYQHPFYPAWDHASAPNLVNLPVPARTRGLDVRELIDMLWLPRLEAHQPQMLLISAGFDAPRDDSMGQLLLVENDYAWITERLCDLAKRHAKGRIVSCLEGGYDLPSLALSVQAHLKVLNDA